MTFGVTLLTLFLVDSRGKVLEKLLKTGLFCVFEGGKYHFFACFAEKYFAENGVFIGVLAIFAKKKIEKTRVWRKNG